MKITSEAALPYLFRLVPRLAFFRWYAAVSIVAVVTMASVPDSSSSGQFTEGDNGAEEQTISPSQGVFLPDPQEITDWLVEFRPNGTAPCPSGFVCDEERMANCTKIRLVALLYGFGDVHAGGYCPDGSNILQVCPAGSYCPTAETMITCPGTIGLSAKLCLI